MLEFVETHQKHHFYKGGSETNGTEQYKPMEPQAWEIRRDGVTVGIIHDRTVKETLECLLCKLQPVHTYVKDAIKTECTYDGFAERVISVKRELHGSSGLCTEAGELLDMLKKHLFYGKPFDRTNAKEELGDILWYTAILCDALGMDIQKIMATNIAKLKARYPNKFTEQDAIHRNLENERKVLEQ